MKYINKYDEYLNEELKNYPLYKGVTSNVFNKIMEDNLIKSTLNREEENDYTFDSPMRWNVSGKVPVISASRNFNTAKRYGSVIFEFDMLKLSSRFKIIPFCENPDYYLDYMKLHESTTTEKDVWLSKTLRDKKHGKLFWKIKTDQGHWDYGICEELIVAKDIDIRKYVKKIYFAKSYFYNNHQLFVDVMDKLEKYNIEVVELD